MAPTVPAVGRAVPMLAVAVLFPTIAPATAVPAAAVCVVTIAPGGMFRIRSAATGTAPVTVPAGVVLPDCKIADSPRCAGSVGGASMASPAAAPLSPGRAATPEISPGSRSDTIASASAPYAACAPYAPSAPCADGEPGATGSTSATGILAPWAGSAASAAMSALPSVVSVPSPRSGSLALPAALSVVPMPVPAPPFAGSLTPSASGWLFPEFPPGPAGPVRNAVAFSSSCASRFPNAEAASSGPDALSPLPEALFLIGEVDTDAGLFVMGEVGIVCSRYFGSTRSAGWCAARGRMGRVLIGFLLLAFRCTLR